MKKLCGNCINRRECAIHRQFPIANTCLDWSHACGLSEDAIVIARAVASEAARSIWLKKPFGLINRNNVEWTMLYQVKRAIKQLRNKK